MIIYKQIFPQLSLQHIEYWFGIELQKYEHGILIINVALLSLSLSSLSVNAPAHLKAVEGAVVFEGEDVVWDGEEVPLSCD